MNKTNYNEIAAAFKHQVNIKQLHYALRGFDKSTGYHTKEGHDLYTFFRSMESLCFTTANSLNDGNDNFDRDTFLKKAGMMQGRGSYGNWSFLPNEEYIAHFNR